MNLTVHQLLSGAGPTDAITAEAMAFRARFRAWGWSGRDLGYRIMPGLNGSVERAAGRLAPAPEDLLLIHHSAAWPDVSELLRTRNRKLLRYHNITPAQWLWDYAPVQAMLCERGRAQLPALAAAADRSLAVSHFNARELPNAEVLPLLLDPARLGAPAPAPAGPPTVLFVGRLSPHKRQDEVIRAFALYRRHRAPDARLMLVGDPSSAAYAQVLRRLADSLAPGAVTIENGLSSVQLGERYRAAHAFLCLSEHEGFCAPLLEAFHFGVPVVARPAGAVPEVTGDAALLVEDRELAVVAELVDLAVRDASLRAELIGRGRERLVAFAPDAVAAQLRAAVEGVGRRR